MTSYLYKKMNKKNRKILKKYILRFGVALGIIILIFLTGILSYVIAYNSRVYPNLSVAGISVAGNSLKDASSVLVKNVKDPQNLTLTYQDQVFNIKTSDIGLTYDFSTSASNAYSYTRTGNIFNDLVRRISLLFKPKNLGLVVIIDNYKLDKVASIFAGQISIDPIEPTVSKVGDKVVVDKGLAGKEVDQKTLVASIMQNLSFNQDTEIQIPVENIDNTLTDLEAENFAVRAQKYLGKNVSLKFEYTTNTLQDMNILKLLGPKGGYIDEEVTAYIQKLAGSIERDPQNPKFVFGGGKVTEFQPALDGIKLDSESLRGILLQKLEDLASSTENNITFDIPVIKTRPEVTTDKVNNLGIKELIGRGTSSYFHSIPSRIHNIALAASRINGTLIKPGETFSFNRTLGDVSAFTGYQQAYIISEGKTILGDGGGVCQVSTTLFRAVLNAGLPIVERQAHAYRVSYYEQGSPPGLDATVYSPSPDFKFTNDTPEYILIEAVADTKNYSLIFELYGTGDGRVATISKSVVTNVVAPPEDRYQDDPTLPAGTIRQVDYKAWGAKVTFNYSVTREGQKIINKTFISNYKAWQAVYLRGTGPAN